MFPRTFILYVLPPSWTGPCLIVAYSFSNPSFASFADLLALLLCHSVIHAMLLFDSCLLGFFWACCMLNSSGPFLIQVFMLFFFFFWTFLAHSIASGLPWLISSFWASSAHSNSLLPWAFAKSFRLPRSKLPHPLLLRFMDFPSTPYSLNLYFGPLWPILACFLFFIIPVGLLLFLSFFKPACFL